jgi:hypothetical protein
MRLFHLSLLGERAGVRGKLGIFSSIREILKIGPNTPPLQDLPWSRGI